MTTDQDKLQLVLMDVLDWAIGNRGNKHGNPYMVPEIKFALTFLAQLQGRGDNWQDAVVHPGEGMNRLGNKMEGTVITKTETKHTATPWLMMPGGLAVSGNDPEGNRYQEIARMIDGNTTCTHLHVTADEMKANALHIVHCVNLHDELVEALKRVAVYFETLEEMQPTRNVGLIGDQVRGLVQQAIAKAAKKWMPNQRESF